MEPIALRLMIADDLPEADGLRRLIGWNQTLKDWRRFLDFEPDGCFVALKQGKVVGTVTTITYGSELAWIGMMLVHPESRREGIASRLMAQAIEYLKAKGIGCIKLDATPAGKPLYERLGFVSEWRLARWQSTNNRFIGVAPLQTRDLHPQDWREVEAIDQKAFGLARLQLLRSLTEENSRAIVWPADGAVRGWGVLRAGANCGYLGPMASASAEGVEALTIALLHAADGRSVFWDIPDPNETAQTIARRFGFAPVRPLTRMYLGRNAGISNLGLLFGIADPALG